ncbi:MAG: hypothetical protein JO126_06195 [Alphaproteobacteria bacterium]|nr:hypothetical protein [Alphaproteobacteria bacterium]MBV8549028.1 hypothetical protein [Alphaproteobacteria bacterium]
MSPTRDTSPARNGKISGLKFSGSIETSRPIKRRTDVFVWIVTIIVIVMVIGGLIISGGSIREKIRIGQAVQQIVSLTGAIRDAASRDNMFGINNRTDLIAAVARTGQITATGSVNGLSSLTNPWDQPVTVVSIPGGQMRMETITSGRICYRLLSVFGQDPVDFGVHRIEVRGTTPNWRQVYNGTAGATAMTDLQIGAACNEGEIINIALLFNLR